MSKPGEAFTQAARIREQRKISETAKHRHAIAAYEKREAERLRNQQALMRAAFYQRHPDLQAAA